MPLVLKNAKQMEIKGVPPIGFANFQGSIGAYLLKSPAHALKL